jgi:hypothetical protein
VATSAAPNDLIEVRVDAAEVADSVTRELLRAIAELLDRGLLRTNDQREAVEAFAFTQLAHVAQEIADLNLAVDRLTAAHALVHALLAEAEAA